MSGVTGTTVLTVTAAVLQSIAVTPANPSIAKGLTEQFTATGTFSDNSTEDLTNQVTWASATPATATISGTGLATSVGQGTSTITATMSGLTGTTVLTVTAPALESIVVTPADPSIAKGETEAVHGHRHVLRQLDGGSDRPGDLGVGRASAATINRDGSGERVWRRARPPSAPRSSGVTGTTVLTVSPAALRRSQ